MRLKIKKKAKDSEYRNGLKGFQGRSLYFLWPKCCPVHCVCCTSQRLQRVVHCLNNICFVPGGNGVLIINKKKGRKKKNRGGGTLAKETHIQKEKKRTKRKFLVIEFLQSWPSNKFVSGEWSQSFYTYVICFTRSSSPILGVLPFLFSSSSSKNKKTKEKLKELDVIHLDWLSAPL